MQRCNVHVQSSASRAFRATCRYPFLLVVCLGTLTSVCEAVRHSKQAVDPLDVVVPGQIVLWWRVSQKKKKNEQRS
jgi:hypothetical protein